MSQPNVIYEKQDSIAQIQLNRPQRLNAVVSELYAELINALKDAARDSDVRVVVLTGKGRAFCVGADIKEHAAGTRTDLQKHEYLELGSKVCREIYEHPKVVIAAVNGYALGAGAEIACSSDFILMKETAEIGFPEASLGTSVGGGITEILPRMVGLTKARELLLTGRWIKGLEAKQIGLATQVFEDDQFETGVAKFAAKIAELAPFSLKYIKYHLNNFHQDYNSRLGSELAAVRTCMLTEDWREGIVSFQEKRPPVYTGK